MIYLREMISKHKSYSCRFLILIFCTGASTISFSQKETEKWYISGNGALDFSSGAPVPLGNNAMNLSWEGCSSISDANGNLLFYTDGSWLYAKNHTVPPNGSNLNGCNSVTQVGIFVPKPGNPAVYYLFIIGGPNGNGSSPPWSLYYNEINTTLNGGNGDITIKGVPILSSSGNCSEKMTAVKHCNGTDYWLLVHDYTGNAYKAYSVTAAGINMTPVISNVGLAHISVTAGDDALGQMKISPNGTKVATTLYQQGLVELCDFNSSTGVVSNPVNLGSVGQYTYGVEFSPDNSKVYASNGGSPATIKQWDVCAGSNAAIISSGIVVASSSAYSMQLASDGKIYTNKFSAVLGVINSPNVAGAGCNYSNNGPALLNPPFTGSSLGLPNFITSYFDSPANSPQAAVVPVNSGNCGCTGSATVSICAVFGTGPYTYSWSNATTFGPTTGLSASVINLCPGTYSVIVNDAACISDTVSFSIVGSGNSFTITPASTPASCGNNNGTASVSVSGGASPYTFLWNPSSQTSSTATGLSPGNYSVTITDANNCTQITVVNVSSSSGGNVTVSSQNVLCNGGSTGLATATTTGGAPPYSYSWSNGQTTSSVTGLSPGNYTVTVADASGCTGTKTVSISQPAAINTILTNTAATCGNSDGSSAATPSGGISPYTYLWSNGQQLQTATGLAAGNYTVTITDANGCSVAASTGISNSNGPTANAGTDATIQQGNSAVLMGSGGINYSWSPSLGLSNPSVSNPAASPLVTTTYCVYVFDAGGCSDSSCVTVYVIPEPVVCGEFYLPNAFSPNEDNENDVFKAYIDPACVVEYKLVIYNRWGEKIFSAKEVTDSWDGSYRGVLSNTSVYAWCCRVLLTNGKEIVREGNVSLIR